jgi:hypothetical protein
LGLGKAEFATTNISGIVTGNPRYHSGEMARPTAVSAIRAMVRGMASGSSVAAADGSAESCAVGAASGAAGAIEATAAALLARLSATATTCVEMVACNCTAANSVRAINDSFGCGGTVNRPRATMAAVAVAPTWAY